MSENEVETTIEVTITRTVGPNSKSMSLADIGKELEKLDKSHGNILQRIFGF